MMTIFDVDRGLEGATGGPPQAFETPVSTPMRGGKHYASILIQAVHYRLTEGHYIPAGAQVIQFSIIELERKLDGMGLAWRLESPRYSDVDFVCVEAWTVRPLWGFEVRWINNLVRETLGWTWEKICP